MQAGPCREVVLTDASSRAPAARLIVTDGTAWLVPSGLKADNAARQVYVLWQITGGHIPLAVGSFDVRGLTPETARSGSARSPCPIPAPGPSRSAWSTAGLSRPRRRIPWR